MSGGGGSALYAYLKLIYIFKLNVFASDFDHGGERMSVSTKKDLVRRLSFGSQVAEEERESLQEYFVKTQAWDRVYEGDVDVVYGPKGSGKSAIYVLIQDHTDSLFDKGILLIPAENPQSAPAFKGLITNPPQSERELIGIWKLYFLTLLGRTVKDYEINSPAARKLLIILDEHNLLPAPTTALSSILKTVRNYAQKLLNPKDLQATISLDPATAAPTFAGKISFDEPTIDESKTGKISIDELFRTASLALSGANFKAWITIDRLDVAFDDSADLEKNALRALFRVYRDVRDIDNIALKIFLRTDIWERITHDGFREATHITRDFQLVWTKQSLQNLIIRRALSKVDLLEFFQVDKDKVLESAASQEELFNRIFPLQIERGENQSTTLDWLLKRTTDGTGKHNPREIILFLNRVCELQSQRLERGEPPPTGEALFDRIVFKEALPALSSYKVTKVLYAEYPDLRPNIEALERQKSEHNPASLARIWELELGEALGVARRLRDLGFFEERGPRENPTFWIPFIFRPYLSLIQGRAEEVED